MKTSNCLIFWQCGCGALNESPEFHNTDCGWCYTEWQWDEIESMEFDRRYVEPSPTLLERARQYLRGLQS